MLGGPPATVSELGERLNCQPVSARQGADIAEQRGIRLPHGTIAGYWRHTRPTATADARALRRGSADPPRPITAGGVERNRTARSLHAPPRHTFSAIDSAAS